MTIVRDKTYFMCDLHHVKLVWPDCIFSVLDNSISPPLIGGFRMITWGTLLYVLFLFWHCYRTYISQLVWKSVKWLTCDQGTQCPLSTNVCLYQTLLEEYSYCSKTCNQSWLTMGVLGSLWLWSEASDMLFPPIVNITWHSTSPADHITFIFFSRTTC